MCMIEKRAIEIETWSLTFIDQMFEHTHTHTHLQIFVLHLHGGINDSPPTVVVVHVDELGGRGPHGKAAAPQVYAQYGVQHSNVVG